MMIYLDILASQGNQLFCTSPLNVSLLKAETTLQVKLQVEQYSDFFKITISLETTLKAAEKAERIDETKIHKFSKSGYYNVEIRTTPYSIYNWFNLTCYNPGT